MSVISDPLASPPRVAFAVGRSVGTAPLRNRVRRRLRALAQAHAGELAPGWYLIGADATFASSPYPAADAQFEALTRAAAAGAPAREVPARRHEDHR
jgi:ribonuclease P protein component